MQKCDDKTPDLFKTKHLHVAVLWDYFFIEPFPPFESSAKIQLLKLLPYMVTGKQNNWLTE